MEDLQIAETLRALLSVSMLSVGAYFDWKTGFVHDKLWLIFSLAAAAVYIAYPPSYGTAWIIALGALLALAGWLSKMYAAGDFAALLALSFILPVFNGIPVILPVLLGAAFLSLAAVLVANPALNIRKIRLGLFSDLDDSALRKFFAFFLVHRYRLGEIHAYCAEKHNGRGRTVWFLSAKNPRHVDQVPVREGTYVGITVPLLVPLAASLVTLLAVMGAYSRI